MTDRHYVSLWAVLMAALLASLALGATGHGTVAVTLIFLVAAFKAALVVGWYMHLRLEPRWVRNIGLGAALVVGAFLAGASPDVVGVFGAIAPGRDALAATHAGRSGEEVFGAYCIMCHQPDCRGGGGRTAPDFVADVARMQKTDADLLHSIAEGRSGSIGVMPAWKGVLTPDEQAAALAHMRAMVEGS